ncbi:MAG: methylated-DNA--[protein]-cysteine S-methyltransferase [Nitriliruptoraceae bacterium]
MLTATSSATATLSSRFDSPVGELVALGDGSTLVGLYFGDSAQLAEGLNAHADDEAFSVTRLWLDTYFAGGRPQAEPSIELRGTPFQVAVWEQLRHIPHGTTCTYQDVATAIGRPSAVRAVAGAIGRNPISIIVPCHRVIGSDGSLTGYGGGLDRKRRLLEVEQRLSTAPA